MKFLLLGLLLSAPALACGPDTLALDYPKDGPLDGASDTPAQVSFSIQGNTLHAHFDVKGAVLSGKKNFAHGDYPYMFDVTELFISAEGGLPYYEFEVSPYNQTLQVKILDLKHPFVNNVNMGLETKATRTPTGWTTDLSIPLDRLGWQGDVTKIVGNAYTIVGKKPNRRYFVRSPLPEQKKLNFHVPAAFRPLLDCVAVPAT
jgi:hypothetical protein